MFIFLKFEIFLNSCFGAIAEPFRENCLQNREIKIFFKYLKWIPFAVKYSFQWYIVCWSKIYSSKIISGGREGGGGGAPSHLRLLFCKIVYFLQKFRQILALLYVVISLFFFAKQMIYSRSSGQVSQNDIQYIHILRVEILADSQRYPNFQPFRRKFLMKSRNRNIFQIFK